MADESDAELWAPGTSKENKCRQYARLISKAPWYHRLFIALVCVQVLYLAVERIVLLTVSSHTTEEEVLEDAWFFGMIMMTGLFIGYYGIHAIISVNAFELITFFAASLMMLIRLVIEYINRSDECVESRAAMCLGFLLTAVAFQITALGLCSVMYNDLKWKRYKAVGAEVETRKMYRRFELFSAVKKLDMQFSLIILFTGLMFFSTLKEQIAEWATGFNAGIFVTEIAFERLGNSGVKRENAWFMYGFWALSGLMPAFVLFVAANWQVLLSQALSSSVRGTIVLFAALAIVNRIATVACSVIMYLNFGENYRGLRRLLEGDRIARFDRQRARAATRHDARSNDASTRVLNAVVVANPVHKPSTLDGLPSGLPENETADDYQNLVAQFLASGGTAADAEGIELAGVPRSRGSSVSRGADSRTQRVAAVSRAGQP